MGFHDNYGDNQDVLVGLGGYDYGWGGQLGPVGMSRTKLAYSNSRVNPYGGVESTMINYGFGLGGGITKSESKVYKLSNGIKKIKIIITHGNFKKEKFLFDMFIISNFCLLFRGRLFRR